MVFRIRKRSLFYGFTIPRVKQNKRSGARQYNRISLKTGLLTVMNSKSFTINSRVTKVTAPFQDFILLNGRLNSTFWLQPWFVLYKFLIAGFYQDRDFAFF